MLDIAFQYDCVKKEWMRCASSAYAHGEIEKLSHTLIIQYENEDKNYKLVLYPQKYVFCRKHRRTERITEIRRNYVTSADGCTFEGLIACCILHLNRTGYSVPTEYVPFRWRIFQQHLGGPINIAGDVAEIHYDRAGVLMHWLNCGISINPTKPVFMTTKIRDLGQKEWTSGTNVEIPDIVVDTALGALRESTQAIFGIKPSMISQMKGHAKLTAYAERPFDIHVVFLKHFLQKYIGRDFDRLFPYECKDNYKKICELLDIHPPKSLRKAYSFNPYAIVWYMLFQRWGIKDINLMQKFFCLDQSTTTIPLDMLYLDKGTGHIKRTRRNTWHDDGTMWQALERLCLWMLPQKGEKKFLRWLYQIATEAELQRWQWDTVLAFYQYETHLSEEVKRILLRDGLTQYVHDQISWEVTAYSKKLQDVHISYEPHILAYECIINGFEFRLMHDTNTLRHVGLTLQNCVATYREAVIGHRSVIVAVRHEGRYVACIEIQRETDIVQALGAKNQRLFGEVLSVCRNWAQFHKLNLATDHLDLIEGVQQEAEDFNLEPIAIEPVTVKAIPYQKTMAEMNAGELLALEAADIRPNYFKYLGMRLLKESKHNIAAPPWMRFRDEREYLIYVFPQGQRIYDAAYEGNSEAQRALGMMYFRGKAFCRNTSKAMDWFSKAAANGDDIARWELEKLQNYINSDMSEKDFDILWGMYRIRNMMQENEYMAEAFG